MEESGLNKLLAPPTHAKNTNNQAQASAVSDTAAADNRKTNRHLPDD